MEDELRLRVRMIGTGLWVSAALIVLVSAWIAVTWDRPHRGVMTAMTAGAALVTALVAALPRARIVSGRWREPFFLSWSFALIVFIAAVADLDDGVRSPIVLMLFLTLVYAALSYPRWAVAVVSVASLLAVVSVGLVRGDPSSAPSNPIYLAGLMTTLAVAGVMCMIQAGLQHEARSDLARLSRADPLTGALNRLGFEEQARASLGRVADRPAALLLLDFDGFKQINDLRGHGAGDDLLRWAVQRMGEALRAHDCLARLGGDEFAVLLPATGASGAAVIAGRLRGALAERIGSSIGVAMAGPDGDDLESLYHAADRRLYAAKGRHTGLRAVGGQA